MKQDEKNFRVEAWDSIDRLWGLAAVESTFADARVALLKLQYDKVFRGRTFRIVQVLEYHPVEGS